MCGPGPRHSHRLLMPVWSPATHHSAISSFRLPGPEASRPALAGGSWEEPVRPCGRVESMSPIVGSGLGPGRGAWACRRGGQACWGGDLPTLPWELVYPLLPQRGVQQDMGRSPSSVATQDSKQGPGGTVRGRD